MKSGVSKTLPVLAASQDGCGGLAVGLEVGLFVPGKNVSSSVVGEHPKEILSRQSTDRSVAEGSGVGGIVEAEGDETVGASVTHLSFPNIL